MLALKHLPQEMRERLHKEDAELLRTGGKVYRESTRPYADGKDHDVLYWQSAFELTDGNIGGTVGVYVDISEQKELERQLEKFKMRMEEELNVGREIQMSMIPLSFPAYPERKEFDVYATLESAREVGGDFYDFFFIDDDHFCICIGDVSGKGVPSALFMAVTKTLIKSRAVDDASTGSIITHVNNELSQDNPSCMFVTLWIGIINVRTGGFTYTNAGHNPPFILNGSGLKEPLTDIHGPVIGAAGEISYSETNASLDRNDTILLYTDGVTEAMNADEELFSDQRLEDLLATRPAENSEQTVQSLILDVAAFQGSAVQADDITVLAFKLNDQAASSGSIALEMTIKNQIAEIETVNERFNAFAEETNVPMQIALQINLVLEEVLSNIIYYGYENGGERDIDIKIELVGKELLITIEDDALPFNPLSLETPDLEASIEDREIGGLGVHLVKNYVDNINYDRRSDKNVLMLEKNVEIAI